MKIALMLGRGIEGVGNTKNAIEFQKYCIKHNIECDIYCVDDRVWPRKKAQPIIVKKSYKFINDSDMSNASNDISKYDFLILYSIPSKKLDEHILNNFVQFVKNVHSSIPVFMISVDHSSIAISGNGKFNEICQNIDAGFTHSLSGSFVKYLEKHNIKLPVYQHAVGYDFDDQRAKYWKPVDDIDLKSMKFIGRSAGWKGPEEFMNLAREMRQYNFAASLEGMEMSIGSLPLFFINGERKNGVYPGISLDNYNKSEFIPPTHGGLCELYGNYQYNECMERLSKTGFGSDLYHLKSEIYGKSLEYCHADVVGVGCIPIFHKHFGDNTEFINSSKHLTEYNTGTIWLDPFNMKPNIELIIKLSEDKKLFDDMRNQSFIFWKSHADNEIVQKRLIKIIADNYL